MEKRSFETFAAVLSGRAREARTPRTMTFELTYGCNLRCVHCYNPTHRALPQELTTDEVRSILGQIADLGVAMVAFSGGEPFARPDAVEIFRYARRSGLLLSLISNATYITPAVADRLGELDFLSLAVSIYGATRETYERVTRVPGSYARFRRGLECLIARRLPVTVRMPVMIDNAAEVRDAQTLVEGLGVKFQYSVDIRPRTNGDTRPLRHRLGPADRVRIDQEIEGTRAGHAVEESCPIADGHFISCACGRESFAVTPYGKMNLCVAFPIPQYDLRRGTVKDGWAALKQTVDDARPNAEYRCPTCDVRRHCIQGRNDAWLETGDMSACLPHFRELAGLESAQGSRRQGPP